MPTLTFVYILIRFVINLYTLCKKHLFLLYFFHVPMYRTIIIFYHNRSLIKGQRSGVNNDILCVARIYFFSSNYLIMLISFIACWFNGRSTKCKLQFYFQISLDQYSISKIHYQYQYSRATFTYIQIYVFTLQSIQWTIRAETTFESLNLSSGMARQDVDTTGVKGCLKVVHCTPRVRIVDWMLITLVSYLVSYVGIMNSNSNLEFIIETDKKLHFIYRYNYF